MKILLIDNYDSFTYNLFHDLSSHNCKVEVYRNDKITINQILNKKYDKIVISPGPGWPKEAGNCMKIVKRFYRTIPILGVCLGHQIIGEVFKSKIVIAKKIMHGKTSLIKHYRSGIFTNIKKIISATRYHSLIVDKKSLGSDLTITAETFDNIIMGIKHKKYNVHGVQFHPESFKTPDGKKILKNFLKN